MTLYVPARIYRIVVFACIVVGALVAMLDLISVAIIWWVYALPGVLLVGAGLWWALETWDRFPDPQPGPGERILARLSQVVVCMVMLAFGVGVVAFLGHFLWTHLDYLILTGLVLLFFLGVFLWSLLPSKKPTVSEASAEARSDSDIVT